MLLSFADWKGHLYCCRNITIVYMKFIEATFFFHFYAPKKLFLWLVIYPQDVLIYSANEDNIHCVDEVSFSHSYL